MSALPSLPRGKAIHATLLDAANSYRLSEMKRISLPPMTIKFTSFARVQIVSAQHFAGHHRDRAAGWRLRQRMYQRRDRHFSGAHQAIAG